MQLKQSTSNKHGWTSAALSMSKGINRRLATWNQVSKLLFGQSITQEVTSNFLEVHDSDYHERVWRVNTNVIRMCITFVI